MELNQQASNATTETAEIANVAEAGNANAEPATDAKKEKTPFDKMQEIDKQYFAATQLEKANEFIQKAVDTVAAAGGKYVFNWDTEQPVPDGYGIAIIPIAKTDKEKGQRVTTGVGICAIPELAEVQKTPEGQTFITDALAGVFMAKCANAIRPRSDGSTANTIPVTVADFITSNRPEGVLVAFNELAPAYVKELKRLGMTLITKEILRSALQSKAFAEQQFPKVPQETWEKIIASMLNQAEKLGKAPGMLEDWKKNRNEAGLPVAEDVDLSGLDFDNFNVS